MPGERGTAQYRKGEVHERCRSQHTQQIKQRNYLKHVLVGKRRETKRLQETTNWRNSDYLVA